jgi:subtilisin family serine protease
MFTRPACIFLFSLVFCADPLSLFSQQRSTDHLEQKFLNWHHQDPEKSNVLGTGVDKAYTELLPDRSPSKTVIVAVIDSGVDIDHEDLKGRIWVNEDEIPANGVDDDHNGYVDDIHGWNFIGNKDGTNLMYETFEYTRVYKTGNGPHFAKAKKLYDEEMTRRINEKKNIAQFEEKYRRALAIIKEKTGISVTSAKDLDAISPGEGQQVLAAKQFLSSRFEMGFSEESLAELKTMNREYLEKFLNTDFMPRTVVGDDPHNIQDNDYGNPDVKGPRSDHGTSVAGVIAALRNNGLGINGIAVDVKIMCLRSTPRGDERDKDVALAIRYAVENGADIINMSFGKAISPEKEFVDQAVKLAEEKDVLIVHGSGNDGRNIDEEESFPSDRYLDGREASNWLTVGASGFMNNESIATVFSNYGRDHVDLFAPGENIISTDSSSTYSMNSGTSLSAPVVSGIAALVLSYYPDLTAPELVRILMESAYKIEKKVLLPGASEDHKKVKFSTLSRTGGIVNAYEAMKKAAAAR